MESHILEIKKIRMNVRLGCTAEERATPQPVEFDVTLFFDEPPPGLWSDQLKDTVCYAEVVEKVLEATRKKEFHLVERLAVEALEAVRVYARSFPGISSRIRVHKLNPPVESLHGGVIFETGDRCQKYS